MISFFISALTVFLTVFHPFHVSVCEVVYSDSDQSLQVSQRVFLDDFEAALSKKYNIILSIDNMEMLSKRDSLIELYLDEKLAITVDGKEKKHQYIGSEIEEDGIWCYTEYSGIRKITSIEFKSTILLERFDDQANIVYFNVMGKEKNIKLDRTKTSYIFELEAN